MLLRTPIRLALLAACAVPALAQEQPTTPAHQPPVPARVTYAGGRITIAAENASLNQILREISQQTGLKITGGVNDERVYGSYGPASTADILAQLLDSTETNMMLIQSSGTAPAELILTPRNGGPTPPDPNAAAHAVEEDRGPIGRRPPDNRFNNNGFNNNGNRPNFPQTRPEQMQRPGTPGNNNGTPNSNSSQPGTTQQSPNSNLTPQQIFEQRRQAQQQQGQPGQQAPQGIQDPLHPQQ